MLLLTDTETLSEGACGLVSDNGTSATTASRVYVSVDEIRVSKGSMTGVGGFTTSGSKLIRGQIGFYF